MATEAKGKVVTLKANLLTPDGIAAFPALRTPDTKFKPVYRIRVFFDKEDENFKKFVKVLKELNFKWLKDNGKVTAKMKKKPVPKCIRLADEKKAKSVGVEIGTPFIDFETKYTEGDDPINVFDASGARTNRPVHGTDLVAIETTVGGWESPLLGIGIKCYLNAVQLLEPRWSGARANAGQTFGARDEYIVDDEDETIDDPDETGLEEEDVLIDDDEDEDDDDLDVGKDDPAGGMV